MFSHYFKTVPKSFKLFKKTNSSEVKWSGKMRLFFLQQNHPFYTWDELQTPAAAVWSRSFRSFTQQEFWSYDSVSFCGFLSFFSPLLFSTNVCFHSSKPAIMYSCSLHTVASRPLPSEKTHVPLPASHPAASLCSAFQLSRSRNKKKEKKGGVRRGVGCPLALF